MHMKKIILPIFWILIGITAQIACRKEGPQGPVGPQGEQGVAGVDGKDGQNEKDGRNGVDGNMKISSKEFSLALPNWVPIYAAPNTTKMTGFRGTANLPEITAPILNAGAVLIYQKTYSGYRLIPYTIMGNGEFSIFSEINQGAISIIYQFPEGAKNSPGTQFFRAVIIPGPQGSGRLKQEATIGWNINRLRHMTYEQVCAVLNLTQ